LENARRLVINRRR